MSKSTSIKSQIDRIQTEVPKDDVFMLLAEEASELAQAAIKMCRVHNKNNPTPKQDAEAWNDLVEEYTDVLNVAQRVLELKPDWHVGNYKLNRWCKRLDEAKEVDDET